MYYQVCHFQLASEAEWTGGKVTTVIGRTINPTLALVRHSCYPTAARVCYANQTLLIAQKNMRAGEPITINYSAPFYAASRNERKDHLYAGYVLNCECEACRADWPLFDSLPPGPAGLGDQVYKNGYIDAMSANFRTRKWFTLRTTKTEYIFLAFHICIKNVFTLIALVRWGYMEPCDTKNEGNHTIITLF